MKSHSAGIDPTAGTERARSTNKWLAASALGLLLGAASFLSACGNAGVVRELREDPDGERARKVVDSRGHDPGILTGLTHGSRAGG